MAPDVARNSVRLGLFPPTTLGIGNASAAGGCSWAGAQASMDLATAFPGNDLGGAQVPFSRLCTTLGSFVYGQGGSQIVQADFEHAPASVGWAGVADETLAFRKCPGGGAGAKMNRVRVGW